MKLWEIKLRELPIKAKGGGVRIEYACTGGCIMGYAWSATSQEDELVRAAAMALKTEHDAHHVRLAEEETA